MKTLSEKQIEYLLVLLRDRWKTILEEHAAVLKDKKSGMDLVDRILQQMETNNQLITDLEKMKRGL